MGSNSNLERVKTEKQTEEAMQTTKQKKSENDVVQEAKQNKHRR